MRAVRKACAANFVVTLLGARSPGVVAQGMPMLKGHKNTITCRAYSKDGTAIVWDVPAAAGRRLRVLGDRLRAGRQDAGCRRNRPEHHCVGGCMDSEEPSIRPVTTTRTEARCTAAISRASAVAGYCLRS
jgi:hypothetical protein